MVDVVLRRVVHQGVFELTRDLNPVEFRDQAQGGVIV